MNSLKSEYFLNPSDFSHPLRKLLGNEIFWYHSSYCRWVNFYTNNPNIHIEKYKEITEEEAFRYILEN